MAQFKFIDLQNTIWREGDPPRAGNDGPPAPPRVPPPRRPLSLRRAVATCWYLLFASFNLAVVWTLLTGEPVTPPLFDWPETPLGLLIGGAMWALTLLLRRWAR